MIHFACPFCHARLKTDTERQSQSIVCPKCRATVEVPGMGERETPPAAYLSEILPDWGPESRGNKAPMLVLSLSLAGGLAGLLFLVAVLASRKEAPKGAAATEQAKGPGRFAQRDHPRATQEFAPGATEDDEAAPEEMEVEEDPKLKVRKRDALDQARPPERKRPAEPDPKEDLDSPDQPNQPDPPGKGPEPKESQSALPKPDVAAREKDPGRLGRFDEAILRRLNAIRKLAGLDPVTIDQNLSGGCIAHARYLIQNDGEPSRGVHEESPELPGYSEAGNKAARASVISTSKGWPHAGWPVAAVDLWLASLFHRVPLLSPQLQRVGIGYATDPKGSLWYVVLDARSGVAQSGEKADMTPVLFPPPDQKDVPLLFGLGLPELPNPLPQAARANPAGYPITATFPEGVVVERVAANLAQQLSRRTPDFVTPVVPLWLSTPERPALNAKLQQNTVCLIPKEPLSPNTTYTVEMSARIAGQEWQQKWCFQTLSTQGKGRRSPK